MGLSLNVVGIQRGLFLRSVADQLHLMILLPPKYQEFQSTYSAVTFSADGREKSVN